MLKFRVERMVKESDNGIRFSINKNLYCNVHGTYHWIEYRALKVHGEFKFDERVWRYLLLKMKESVEEEEEEARGGYRAETESVFFYSNLKKDKR